jgi:hypothetical protein
VTVGRRKTLGWRALSVALCYALALQAILAAFGSALAVGNAGAAEGLFTICHGGAADSTPAGDDSGNTDKLPCALCAVAVAGGGLVPVEGIAPATPLIVIGRIAVVERIALPVAAPVRAGLSRAPPRFA